MADKAPKVEERVTMSVTVALANWETKLPELRAQVKKLVKEGAVVISNAQYDTTKSKKLKAFVDELQIPRVDVAPHTSTPRGEGNVKKFEAVAPKETAEFVRLGKHLNELATKQNLGVHIQIAYKKDVVPLAEKTAA